MEVERLKPPLDDCWKNIVVSTEKLGLFLCVKNGRNEKEFTLATRYTVVFNAQEVEGMPELQVEHYSEITMDELVQKLSEGMGVEIMTDGGDRAYYSLSQDKIHLPTPESFHSEYAFNATALHEEAHYKLFQSIETKVNRNLCWPWKFCGFFF